MSGNNSVDWHGSFAVIVTPFTRDGDIDEEGYRGVIDLVIDAGCHGVISAGSTGEFFLMTHEERMRVFSIAVAQAAGLICNVNGSVETGIGNLANIHLAAAAEPVTLSCVVPASTPAEHLGGRIGGIYYTDDLIAAPFEVVDGAIKVPAGPGMGIDVDPAKIERYRVKQPN